MRAVVVVLMALLPLRLVAQTVQPGDLTLEVEIVDTVDRPFVGEMVLVTLTGTFRLPIIREKMIQPDLDGFSWMQLGLDYWSDEMRDGFAVKVFRRRMALFPDRAGDLEIGAFTHRLTLLGPQNKWVEYDIQSEPLTLQVAPQPEVETWWLPVKQLKVSDDWSNAPDNLGAGEGVLRVIRIEALGISPDLLPPMPEMKSPSAVIFPHPEKRLVDLSPKGPVAVAYWRWTVMPQEPPSAIIEPMTIDFFDTVARQMRRVVISPQRVAVANSAFAAPTPPAAPGGARTTAVLAVLALGLVLGLGALAVGRSGAALAQIRVRLGLDPERRALAQAARQGDAAGVWRAAQRLGVGGNTTTLAELEAALFGQGDPPDLVALRRHILSTAAPRQR